MTRLIDADALKREQMKAFNCEDATKYGNKDAKQQERSYSTIMLYEVSDIIEDTIDNAPTVEARPHGKWIGWWTGQEHIVYCSNCKEEYYPDDLYQASGDELPNFCLQCGADMREEAPNDPN